MNSNTVSPNVQGGISDKMSTNAFAKQPANSVSKPPEPPPDGGLVAWLQVMGAFFLMFNTWYASRNNPHLGRLNHTLTCNRGNVQSFGAYQTYWETGELFQASSSDISWIGALQGFFLLFVGAGTGPLYDAGHFRILTTAGSFMIVFGQMMLSLCTQYWQALLAQAFCTGIGYL